MRIQFLGAAEQVTGSCYFVEAAGLRLLVDCGLYQERAFLDRNWAPFPVPPESVDCLLLTHVHLDHSGLLPKLVREGFRKPIFATPASAELLPLVLLDAARVQEEDAAFKRKRHKKEGRRGRHPEVPLYTEVEASRVAAFVRSVPYEREFRLHRYVTARFREAGHILGSALVELWVRERKSGLRVVFSGDLGRPDKPLLHDPEVVDQAQVVVMEATYGDRDHHDSAEPETVLARVVRETVKAGGNVVIPVFAVERAQELLFHLSRLIRSRRIPRVPIFLDSPLAADVTEVFLRHPDYLDEETRALMDAGQSPFEFPGLRFVRTQEESKALNSLRRPAIIMAGAGMCTGGRIKHHLVHNLGRPESTILFVGYQAAGTLGRQILDGKPEVRIFGRPHRLEARVEQIQGFSGHADRSGLIRWLARFRPPLPLLFLTHAESEVASDLAAYLRRDRRFDVTIPGYGETYEITPSLAS